MVMDHSDHSDDTLGENGDEQTGVKANTQYTVSSASSMESMIEVAIAEE